MVYYIFVGIFSSNLLYHKKDCFPTLLRVVAVFFIARFFTAPLFYSLVWISFFAFCTAFVGLRLLRLCPFLVSEVEQEIYSAMGFAP